MYSEDCLATLENEASFVAEYSLDPFYGSHWFHIISYSPTLYTIHFMRYIKPKFFMFYNMLPCIYELGNGHGIKKMQSRHRAVKDGLS